jgi:hypothetical protein
MTIDVAALAPRLQAALGDTLQVGDVLGVRGCASVFRNRVKRPGDTRLKGYLIISRGRASADTLYNDLGGLDVTRLLIALYAHRKEIGGDKP